LSYIYQLLYYIILSYIYQLLYYIELYLSTLNVNIIYELYLSTLNVNSMLTAKPYHIIKFNLYVNIVFIYMSLYFIIL